MRGTPIRRKTAVAARASAADDRAQAKAAAQPSPGPIACVTDRDRDDREQHQADREADERRDVRAEVAQGRLERGGEQQRRQEDEQDEVRLEARTLGRPGTTASTTPPRTSTVGVRDAERRATLYRAAVAYQQAEAPGRARASPQRHAVRRPCRVRPLSATHLARSSWRRTAGALRRWTALLSVDRVAGLHRAGLHCYDGPLGAGNWVWSASAGSDRLAGVAVSRPRNYRSDRYPLRRGTDRRSADPERTSRRGPAGRSRAPLRAPACAASSRCHRERRSRSGHHSPR